MHQTRLVRGLLGKFLQFADCLLVTCDELLPNWRTIGKYLQQVVVTVHKAWSLLAGISDLTCRMSSLTSDFETIRSTGRSLDCK